MQYLKYALLCISFLLLGCSEQEKISKIDDPELVAVAFFNALFNEKDIKKAASVCSPKLAKLVLHYQLPQAVGRHLFNMSYDTVEVKPENSGVKIREQFKNEAIVTLLFDGYLQENRFMDIKRLSLIEVDGIWVIDEILKDPF